MINKKNIISAEYVYDDISNERYSVIAVVGTTKYHIPIDEANRDYQEILEWVENGGVIVDNGA